MFLAALGRRRIRHWRPPLFPSQPVYAGTVLLFQSHNRVSTDHWLSCGAIGHRATDRGGSGLREDFSRVQHRLQAVLSVALNHHRGAGIEIDIQILGFSRSDGESPPAIRPDGILIPVVDSDESRKACRALLGSLVSMTQLATLPHLFPFTLTLLSERITLIC